MYSATANRALARVAKAVLLALAGIVVLFLALGHLCTLPANAPVWKPRSNVAWEEVRADATGRSTAAWFHPGRGPGGGPARRGVVVAHGVWGDRNDMVPRGELLAARGFAVLLVDLYAHGETFGWKMTFLVCVSSLVMTEARPTSEPVPEVVGTAITGAMPAGSAPSARQRRVRRPGVPLAGGGARSASGGRTLPPPPAPRCGLRGR